MSFVRFRYLDNLKFYLAVCVVLIHSGVNTNAAVGDISIYIRFNALLSEFLFCCINPVFFVISGILFFKDGVTLSRCDYYAKWKGRIKTLLIPYLIWNTIGMITFLVKTSPGLLHVFPQYANVTVSAETLVKGYFAIPTSIYPYDLPLWFIRNLLIVVGLSPIIGFVVKRFRWRFLVGFMFATVALIHFYGNCYYIPSAVLFFAFGAIVVHYQRELLTAGNAMAWVVAYLLICSIIHFLLPSDCIITELIVFVKKLIASVAAIKISVCLTNRGYNVNKFLGSSMFFIFAFHGLFITVTSKAIARLLPPVTSMMCFVDFMLTFVVLFGSSLLAFSILKYVSPRVLAVLCGNRN